MQAQSDVLNWSPLFSVVTRYPVTDDIVVDVGVTNADMTMASASADTNVFAGIHVTLEQGR